MDEKAMREAFEVQYGARRGKALLGRTPGDAYEWDCTEEAWLWWRTAAMSQKAEAPGWVMVPVEPTPEMSKAGSKQGNGGGYDWDGPDEIYRVMVAAAPKEAL